MKLIGLTALFFVFCLWSPKWANCASLDVIFKRCPFEKKAPVNQNCKDKTEKVFNGSIVISLTGTIDLEDTDKLQTFLTKHVAGGNRAMGYDGSFVTLLMNDKDGGDYDAGIRLGRFLRENAIRTRIVNGATCASACALAFMGGASIPGRLFNLGSDRTLEAGGHLIFHTPWGRFDSQSGSLNASQIGDIFRQVYTNLSDYAATVGIPAPILTQVLNVKRNGVFEVDTVFWARISGVAVDGFVRKNQLADDDYKNACYSEFSWNYGFEGVFVDDNSAEAVQSQKTFNGVDVIADTATEVLTGIGRGFNTGLDLYCIFSKGGTDLGIDEQILAGIKDRNGALPDSEEKISPNRWYSKIDNVSAFQAVPVRGKHKELYFYTPGTKLTVIADKSYVWRGYEDE